jgi:hypothetical protein
MRPKKYVRSLPSFARNCRDCERIAIETGLSAYQTARFRKAAGQKPRELFALVTPERWAGFSGPGTQLSNFGRTRAAIFFWGLHHGARARLPAERIAQVCANDGNIAKGVLRLGPIFDASVKRAATPDSAPIDTCSCASPCGPAMLVIQDPCRTSGKKLVPAGVGHTGHVLSQGSLARTLQRRTCFKTAARRATIRCGKARRQLACVDSRLPCIRHRFPVALP